MRLALALVLLLAACAPTGAPPPVPGERIISVAPNLTELLYAAGAGEGLVGVSEFSDHPPAARSLPRIGNAFRLDYERILALAPTVAVVWESGTPEESMRQLEALGLRLVRIETRSLEDIARAIEILGALSGDPAIASASAQAFRAGLAALRARYRDRPLLPVFVMIDDAPLYTVGGRHLINEILALCGGVNVFADATALALPVDLESVMARAPRAILSTDDGDPGAYWSRYPQLEAVAAGKVYAAPADALARPGPRMVGGAERVCELLEDARGR